MPRPHNPLDHISLPVTDLRAAREFYDAVLGEIGIAVVKQFPHALGYGTDRPFFWLHQADPERSAKAGLGLHVCFGTETRAAVDRFHATALEMGGKDNGAPGLRPHYHESYYGAFVIDADGYKIEAVCHRRDG